MSTKPEGTAGPAAPTSDVAKQALAELEKEGITPEGDKPAEQVKETPPADPNKKEEPEKKEDKKEEPQKPKDDTPPPPKVDRDVSLTPTWKLKVAESQREAAEKKAADLQAKLDEFTKKPSATPDQKQEIANDIDKFLAENEVDEANAKLLKGFAERLMSKFEGKVKVPDELLNKVNSMEQEKKVLEQEQGFSSEFEKEVLPLIKAEYPHLTDEGLSEVKSKLHTLAFTEEYKKVSLKKIFKAEKDDLKIPPPDPKKKTGEASSKGKDRGNDTIDFDNMDEDTFASLTPEQTVAYSDHMAKKNGKKWNAK